MTYREALPPTVSCASSRSPNFLAPIIDVRRRRRGLPRGHGPAIRVPARHGLIVLLADARSISVRWRRATPASRAARSTAYRRCLRPCRDRQGVEQARWVAARPARVLVLPLFDQRARHCATAQLTVWSLMRHCAPVASWTRARSFPRRPQSRCGKSRISRCFGAMSNTASLALSRSMRTSPHRAATERQRKGIEQNDFPAPVSPVSTQAGGELNLEPLDHDNVADRKRPAWKPCLRGWI